MRKPDKKIQNIILITGFIVIYILIIFLLILKPGKEEKETSSSSLITEEDLIEDAKKHPELAISDDWIEPNLTEEELADEFFSGETVPETICAVKYRSSKTQNCELFNGGQLTVGINTQDTSAIYLNPAYENGSDSPSDQYGIYVAASDGNVFYSTAERVSEGLTDGKCFVVTDRTYDTLIPSDAGTCWKKSTDLLTNAEMSVPVTVSFRVLRFSDYTIIGTARASITCIDGTYELKDLVNTDVLSTGEMSFESRQSLIQSAIDYIFDSSRGPSFSSINESYTDVMLSMATVEHCRHPYFSSLSDSSCNSVPAGALSNCDLYAVNIPYIGTGNITVYFAPTLQADGFNVSSTFFLPDEDLQPIGYDYLYPFSRETLLIPPEE